jgi:hypothetical protein
MMNDAAATYNNIDAQKKLDAQNKKGASQQESIAQKLANLKQQSELAADSTQQLSREQAILTAQQSLGKGQLNNKSRWPGSMQRKNGTLLTLSRLRLLPRSCCRRRRKTHPINRTCWT